MEKHIVVAQRWEESERGWGCRDDGWTYHSTTSKLNDYEDNMWNREKEIYGNRVPDCYSRRDGPAKLVEVDQFVWELIRERELNYGGTLGTDEFCEFYPKKLPEEPKPAPQKPASPPIQHTQNNYGYWLLNDGEWRSV